MKMKCPNCGGELKQLPKNPNMYRCQSCKKYFEKDKIPEAQNETEDSQASMPAPPDKPQKKKGKGKIIGIVVAVIVVLAIVAGVLGGSDETQVSKNNNSEESNPVSSAENQGDASETAGSVQTVAQEAEQEQYGIGQTADINNIQTTLVSATESSGSEFNTPSEGNVFVLLEFEIANNSDDEISISSLMSFDAYCDDYSISTSLSGALETDKSSLDGTVASGKKLNGVIAYEVPADWSEIEVHFTADYWSGDDIVFIATK